MSKKRRDRKLAADKPGDAIPASNGFFDKDTLTQIGQFALIFLVTVMAYQPAINGAFLWDDDGHVTKPELQSLHGFWRIWSDLRATQQYYPVLHSAFWLEHWLWGDAAFAYHLINLIWHAGAACLLVAIARQLALPGSLLAGFVFALHPVCVEAVAWISEQKSTLSGFLCLASALVYLHFDRSRLRSRYFVALALFVLALLSKTVTAVLPAALLVVFWWQRGRLNWKRDVLPLLPWFTLSAGAAWLTSWVEKTYIGAKGADFSLSLLQRVLLASRAIWFYAAKIFWPADLIFIYPHWDIDPGMWWQYLFPAGILVVLILLGWMAQRNRGPLATFLIFAGTLFPALGFINVFPFIYSYVADHFQYLAMAGVMVPLMAGLVLASRGIPRREPWLPMAAAVVLVGVLGVLTWRQSGMYSDLDTLYRETIARNPNAWMAHNNLAYRLLSVPRGLPEAISHLQTAIRLHSPYAEAHVNLGIAYSLSKRWPEAVDEYQAALRADPTYSLAHANLGNALSNMPGRMPEAISEFEAALHYDPNSSATHYNLARALAQTPGRTADAIVHVKEALRLSPGWDKAERLLEQLQQSSLPTAIPGTRHGSF
jgi:tetratricopeptide (TPR) repeat protein